MLVLHNYFMMQRI
uniref:Uncharacterized protein n=1 Tax=Anguilla anguilla TaxID=7936 RepID=A0A0E9RX85_ANGAN